MLHLSHGEEIKIARAVNEETSKYYHQASPKDEEKNKNKSQADTAASVRN